MNKPFFPQTWGVVFISSDERMFFQNFWFFFFSRVCMGCKKRGWCHCHSLLIVLCLSVVSAAFRSPRDSFRETHSGSYFTFLIISLNSTLWMGMITVAVVSWRSHLNIIEPFILTGKVKIFVIFVKIYVLLSLRTLGSSLTVFFFFFYISSLKSSQKTL